VASSADSSQVPSAYLGGRRCNIEWQLHLIKEFLVHFTQGSIGHALTEDKESPISQYQRHLLLEKHGFLLWAPQPLLRLPPSYRRTGVSVGDVGIITSQGSFDYLFNICLSRGQPRNPEVLPIDFSPINLLPSDISELREHDSGACLMTDSIKKSRYVNE
jgi:hypothetical protein